MKLILSRKGLDSSFGPFANPIFPDGRLCWIPIPELQDSRKPGLPRYADITFGEEPLGPVIQDLSRGKIGAGRLAHLDPDLDDGFRPRKPGWRPSFGQTGAAESHLRAQGVGDGDVFLFFGWYRAVDIHAGQWHYVNGAPDLHVMYGWFQVDHVLDVHERDLAPEWVLDHPHFQGQSYGPVDVVRVATDELVLNGKPTGLPGAGLFPFIHDELTLTEPGRLRSCWKVPAWMFPEEPRPPLSYHTKPERWEKADGFTRLQAAGRGQEFVLDMDMYPEAAPWVADLVRRHG